MNCNGKVVKLDIKKEPLTAEKLKTYKGLENLSEEEAEKIVDALMKFAKISLRAYRLLMEEEQKNKKAA